MNDSFHSIKSVARRTGLSPHVIRIWERRYAAVKPVRTATNRRTYSEADIARLALLRQATQVGHGIGHIAQLPTEQLRDLVAKSDGPSAVLLPQARGGTPGLTADAAGFVEEALACVEVLDAAALERVLSRAALTLGQQGFLTQIIVPLVQRIGDSWQAGKLRAAHEHVATAVVRTFLGNFSRPYQAADHAPRVLITTPAGQLHELGAIMAAVTAHNLGWTVTYLGPSLPADEIAGAAVQGRVRAVALSIVYPTDDPHLPAELIRLRQFLPAETTILVGGRAAPAYEATLTQIGVVAISDLAELAKALERLRTGDKPRQANGK